MASWSQSFSLAVAVLCQAAIAPPWFSGLDLGEAMFVLSTVPLKHLIAPAVLRPLGPVPEKFKNTQTKG